MIRKKRKPTTESDHGSRPELSSHRNSAHASLTNSGAHGLPHKGRRSAKAAATSTRRSAQDPKKGAVKPPEIGVKILGRSWSGHRYAPAKIRIRNGCYRYLVWRDGFFKREFYLGKVKNLAPQRDRVAAPELAAAAGAGRISIGGKNMSTVRPGLNASPARRAQDYARAGNYALRDPRYGNATEKHPYVIRLRRVIQHATAQLEDLGAWGLTPEVRRCALWGMPLRDGDLVDLVDQAQLGILGTAEWCREQIEAELVRGLTDELSDLWC